MVISKIFLYILQLNLNLKIIFTQFTISLNPNAIHKLSSNSHTNTGDTSAGEPPVSYISPACGFWCAFWDDRDARIFSRMFDKRMVSSPCECACVWSTLHFWWMSYRNWHHHIWMVFHLKENKLKGMLAFENLNRSFKNSNLPVCILMCPFNCPLFEKATSQCGHLNFFGLCLRAFIAFVLASSAIILAYSCSIIPMP